MAENKLSWTELRRAIATRAGVSEKEANAFLTAYQSQLVAALKEEKQVKINGLGIFRLQEVAPRKSVNVKTGEEITIEGYNKIAFVPEAGVKELVESRKQAEAVDPLQKLGAQAEEIVDILGELGQSPKETKAEEKPVEEPVKPAEPETPVAAVEPATLEIPAEPEAPQAPEKPVAPEPKKKSTAFRFVRDTLIVVVILLMILLAGFFFLRQQLSSWIDSLMAPKEQVETVVEPAPEPVVMEEPAPVAEEPAPVVETPAPEPDLLLTETITEGSRMTWIAKKHYGDKQFWPYIYEANKAEYPNPSKIAVGSKVKVPKLTKEQKDLSNPQSRARLEQLLEEAEAACRK